MALLHVNFRSSSVMRNVPLQVILPVDNDPLNGALTEKQPFKTLYLLHGLTGNYIDWITNTRIQRWAEMRNLAVVMPSGDNSFYVNTPVENGCFGDFGEFIGKELVDITRRMFPLSHKREDTFIAGLSMGGFGALRNGFRYNDTFGYIAALSSAIHIFEYPFDDPNRNVINEDTCFGDIQEAANTDKNPRVIVEELMDRARREKPVNLPKTYIACGTEDYLLGANKKFYNFLLEKGLDVTYEEGPGEHDWDFWDKYIEKVLNWLPLNQD